MAKRAFWCLVGTKVASWTKYDYGVGCFCAGGDNWRAYGVRQESETGWQG